MQCNVNGIISSMEDCEDRKNFTMQYWQYYCMLEEDCVSLRKFVDFREENMSTCSDEIIKQILSVCSEFDGLCEIIYRVFSSESTIELKNTNHLGEQIRNKQKTTLKTLCDEAIWFHAIKTYCFLFTSHQLEAIYFSARICVRPHSIRTSSYPLSVLGNCGSTIAILYFGLVTAT